MGLRRLLYLTGLLISFLSACTPAVTQTITPGTEPTSAPTATQELSVETVVTQELSIETLAALVQEAVSEGEVEVMELVFPPGETATSVAGAFFALNRHEYHLSAQKGQVMTIHLYSSDDDVTYTIYGIGDQQVLMQNSVADSLSLPIPATQQYAIAVVSNGENPSYALSVEMPLPPEENDCVITTATEFDVIPPTLPIYEVSWAGENAWLYSRANNGSGFKVVLSTADGWYGVDTGVSGKDYSRLRWIKHIPGESLISGPCDVPQVLSFDTLANATYSIGGMSPVSLTDGKGQLAGIESNPDREFILTAFILEFGDLDGNDTLETLVVLFHHTGGTGHFMELVALENKGGQAIQLASARIGGRIVLHDIVADKEGVIHVDITETFSHERTPSCCGPQRVTVRFKLIGGELVELEHDVELEHENGDDFQG